MDVGTMVCDERPVGRRGVLAAAPDVTPKPGVQYELGELASTLDRLSKDHEATDAKVEVIGEALATIQKDLALLAKDLALIEKRDPEAGRLRFTAGVVYAIVAATVIIIGSAYGIYQAADAKANENKAAIHDMTIKLEAQEKVTAAEQRLRDYEKATVAATLDRVEKLSQLNAAYITSLQRDQRK